MPDIESEGPYHTAWHTNPDDNPYHPAHFCYAKQFIPNDPPNNPPENSPLVKKSKPITKWIIIPAMNPVLIKSLQQRI